jgi:hypothetical protein
MDSSDDEEVPVPETMFDSFPCKLNGIALNVRAYAYAIVIYWILLFHLII